MQSKLKSCSLVVAGWGLLHGEFFDLYDIEDYLQVPAESAGKVMVYLRSLQCVETQAETRRCKRKIGRPGATRIFIKVIAIHPEQVSKTQPPKLVALKSTLARLSRVMPSPRGSR